MDRDIILKETYAECAAQLREIGIKPASESVEIKWRSYKRKWGQCMTDIGKCRSVISINPILLDGKSDALKTTVMHELLHACFPNCGHKGDWKRAAELVNKRYGYNISRTTSDQEKGVKLAPCKRLSYKYEVRCPDCQKIVAKYKKMGKVVKHPEHYRCGICGCMNLEVSQA